MSGGEKAVVIGVRRGKKGTDQVEAMGLRVGYHVEMLRNEGRGPVLVKVGNSRIAMARETAMHIQVRLGAS